MIPASTLAQLCADSYDDTKRGTWADYWEIDDIHVCRAIVGDTDVLVFRGSDDATDWIRDAETWPVWHDKLGFVHAGFVRGMDDVLTETLQYTGPRVAITGHSLGGARARIMAALRIINGLPVNQLCVFGSPKPGFANVSRVIQKSGIPHASYRNRNDPVPMVPGILPMWQHPEPWATLDVKPADDSFESLRDHSIGLYLVGAQKQEKVNVPAQNRP